LLINNKKSNIIVLNNSMSFRLISDPEGFAIEQLSNITSLSSDEKLIILGDLIDSTCGTYDFPKPPSEILMEKFGDKSTNKKAFNLRNLQWITDEENNKKIEAVLVGNRDLNKLKCIPLLNFRDNTKWWDNGNSYLEIAENLVKTLEPNGNGWSINDENLKKYWYPWWNNKFVSEQKEWNPKVDPENHCLRRFQLIFGADGSVGTMSADNLLETIPMELFQTKKIVEDKFNMLTPNTKAALVLVVFRRLLLPIPRDKGKLTFDGLLYNYFKNEKVKVCYHKDFGDEDLAIFSHAGMTKTFFDNDDLIKTYTTLMTKIVLDPDKNVKQIVSSINKREKIGGFYRKTENKIAKHTIMDRIDLFNNKTKKLIEGVLEIQQTNVSQPSPSTEELVLILLGVPLLPHDIREQNKNLNPESVGPIQPGIIKFRKNPSFHFTLYEGDLYQFVGHAPLGYGPTIDLYEYEKTNNEEKEETNNEEKEETNNEVKHVFVNVDISNSLIGHIDLTDTTKDNYCYVKYDNKNIEFSQSIVIKDTTKMSNYLYDDTLKYNFNVVKGGKVDELVKNEKYKDYSFHGKVNGKDFITNVKGYDVTIVSDLQPESVGKKKFRSMKKRKTKKNKNGKKTKRKLISRKRRYSKKK